MDDLTWQRSLALRDQRIRRQKYGLLLSAIAAILGAIAIWYSCFYTKTPEYALKEAQAAIEQRDSEKFARYVNLDLLTSQAYDDLTVDLFAYDATLTPKTRVLFEKFYVLVKPELSRGAAEAITRRIDSGLWTLPDGLDILKGRQLGIDFERFLERTQLRNTTLVSVGHVTHDGSTATAELNIREDCTDTSFTLVLALEEAADGHWQIAYIKNYHDYLDTVAPLINGDIADYIETTKPIVDDANEIFAAQKARFAALSRTSDGRPSAQQRKEIAEFLEDDVIPALKDRQKKLDEIDVPAGAGYLARQRQLSTETTIRAWQHYIKGLRGDQPREFDAAETLLKQELAIDLRVDDIIKHTAVSKNIPNLP